MTKIIAVLGNHRTGKSTLAKLIGELEGYTYISLAAPVRSLLFKLCLDTDVYDGSKKNKICAITKKRPRAIPASMWDTLVCALPPDEENLTIGIMLKLLTELFTPEHFHKITAELMKEASAKNKDMVFVIDDFRYISTLKFFRRRKAIVSYLWCPSNVSEYEYAALLAEPQVRVSWCVDKEHDKYTFSSNAITMSIKGQDIRVLKPVLDDILLLGDTE